jgi:membrane protease YdiL (CAAX protease family)
MHAVRGRVGMVRVRSDGDSRARPRDRPKPQRNLRASLEPRSQLSQLRQPSVRPVLVAYVVTFFLVNLVTTAVVFAVAWARARGSISDLPDVALRFALSAAGVMAAAFVAAIILGIVTFVTARLQAQDVVAMLRLGPTRASNAGLASAVVGMAGLSLASGAACDLLGWRQHSAMAAIARALERPATSRLVIAIAAIAIAPALAEEGFFRGLIQTRLAARWGSWPSIVVTAIGFGLYHLDPAQASVAFVAGLFLGWLTELFGGIRPAIFAHAFNNAAFVVIASFGSAGDSSRSSSLWLLATGSAVCFGAIALLRSQLALSPEARQIT